MHRLGPFYTSFLSLIVFSLMIFSLIFFSLSARAVPLIEEGPRGTETVAARQLSLIGQPVLLLTRAAHLLSRTMVIMQYVRSKRGGSLP